MSIEVTARDLARSFTHLDQAAVAPAGNSDRGLVAPKAPDHLFTWVDVDRYFADLASRGHWPSWLYEISAFWDGVQIAVAPDVAEDQLWDFLSSVLGPLTVDRSKEIILLDSVLDSSSDPDRYLSVEIERTETGAARDPRPQWGPRRIVGDWFTSPYGSGKDTLPHDVSMGVFHSFKGGVGRTLHCVATAHAIAASGRRVLLVDADLEAPGITWMAQAQSLRIDFAFEDFLALMHGSEDNLFRDAIQMGSKFLANQELDRVILMPSRRDYSRLEPARIQPIDVLTADRDAFVLSDTLAELAHAMGADVVLVDLRAGVSDLNSPLLLDRRLHRVIVSTISDQSFRGTRHVLEEIIGRAPAQPDTDDPAISVLLTQFSLPDHEIRMQEIAAEIRDVLLAPGETGAADLLEADLDLPIMVSPFDHRFLDLPGSWSRVRELISRTDLAESVGALASALSAHGETMNSISSPVAEVVVVVDGATGPDSIDSLDDSRRNLEFAAQELNLAGSPWETEFLATDALGNLAESHRTELPVEVIIGAQGSGKTFTFLQICQRMYWADFVLTLTGREAVVGARTVPVLWSAHIPPETTELLQQRRAHVASIYNSGSPVDRLAIVDLIRSTLAEGADDATWRRTWLTCFAWSLGLRITSENAEAALASLALRGRLLFVLDGLEDIFDDFNTNAEQQRALCVLLTDVPAWMRSLRQRPLGLLTFVRQDLAQAAVTQNFAQFQARHGNYALRWSREEALRLAAWVCLQGGVFEGDGEFIDDWFIMEATDVKLSRLMIPVWGEKMGSTKSKEARSEQWFSSALADFTGQIQARDIVTFIRNAARLSLNDNKWYDRVLTPPAMRGALAQCSRSKIEAITQENRPVGRLLTTLSELPDDRRRVPFSLESVGLSLSDARLLEVNGVLFREGDIYWIPEIFRHGLSFRALSRPRSFAVANLVRRKNGRSA